MTEQLLANGKTAGQKKDYSKCYLSLAVILFLCLIALGGFTYYYIYFRKGDEICGSEECLRTSLEIATSIDDSINPCDDFTTFTCGSFSKKRRLYFTPRESIREERINNLISEDISEDDWAPLSLQKQFYASCLDEASIDGDFNNDILDVAGELGGWPMLIGQWDGSKLNLTNFFLKCAKLGLPFEWFFKISYGPAPGDEETSVIRIGKPDGIGHFIDSVKDAAYLELIVETVRQLGGSNEATHAARWIIDLEYKLNTIWRNYDPSEDELVRVSDLPNLFPYIDIPYLLKNLTSEYLVPSNDSVVSTNSIILKDIDRLLAGESDWTKVNFIIWKIIQERGVFLSTPLREKFGNFENFYAEGYPDLSREGICLTEAKKRFPLVAKYAYLQNLIDINKAEKINEMIDNIKENFVMHINSADWIANETRPIVANKVKNIKVAITVYEDQQDGVPDLLEIMSNEVNLTSLSIYEMLSELNKFNFMFRLVFMNQTSVDPTQFSDSFEDGFEYNDETNELVLPSRVLEDNLFVEDRPNYINYGLLGTQLTRQIARALHPDALAGIEESPELYLWKNDTDTDIRLFLRTRCIVDQYVNSKLTGHDDTIFSENYINLISLDVAYESYLSDPNTPSAGLPNLESYGPDQLFWIVHQIQICSGDEESVVDEEYRALNPIQNSRYFGKLFECPENSIMNRNPKCIIF